jgi:hypothetical protein
VNPFQDRDPDVCETTPCECCRELGKLDLDPTETDQEGIGDSSIEPGLYEFTEGGEGYRLLVTETIDKPDEDETVAVVADIVPETGAPPLLCEVAVAGGAGGRGSTGPAVERYDRGPEGTFTTTTSRLSPFDDGFLYASHRDGHAPGGEPGDPGEYYAISHLTVSVCVTDESRCSQ